MNFKKLILAVCTVASFGLVACGGGSSSSSDDDNNEESSSSSSAAQIILPEANADSIEFSNFDKSYASATTLKFTGNIVSDYTDTTMTLDSVKMVRGDANGYAIDASFSIKTLDLAERVMINIGMDLAPTLDLNSIASCGSFKAYIVVYGHNASATLIAKDSVSFEKECEQESSSSEAVVDPELTAWTITLSTGYVDAYAVDLDTKTTYTRNSAADHAAELDLYFDFDGSDPVLYTNGALDNVTAASTIAEETKSGSAYGEYPNPAHMSDFKGENETISVGDFSMASSWIVRTPSYDATTGKGFFVLVLDKIMEDGNDQVITFTVLGNWD